MQFGNICYQFDQSCICDWRGEAVNNADINTNKIVSNLKYFIRWEVGEKSIKHCYIWQTIILKSNFISDINELLASCFLVDN